MSKTKFGTFAVVILVLLRFVVGFHFFKEGQKKVREGNFSSAPFLRQAKGPLADRYKSMLPDNDIQGGDFHGFDTYMKPLLEGTQPEGTQPEGTEADGDFDVRKIVNKKDKKYDAKKDYLQLWREDVAEAWSNYVATAGTHYKLREAERQVAQDILKAHVQKLDRSVDETRKWLLGEPHEIAYLIHLIQSRTNQEVPYEKSRVAGQTATVWEMPRAMDAAARQLEIELQSSLWNLATTTYLADEVSKYRIRKYFKDQIETDLSLADLLKKSGEITKKPIKKENPTDQEKAKDKKAGQAYNKSMHADVVTELRVAEHVKVLEHFVKRLQEVKAAKPDMTIPGALTIYKTEAEKLLSQFNEISGKDLEALLIGLPKKSREKRVEAMQKKLREKHVEDVQFFMVFFHKGEQAKDEKGLAMRLNNLKNTFKRLPNKGATKPSKNDDVKQEIKQYETAINATMSDYKKGLAAIAKVAGSDEERRKKRLITGVYFEETPSTLLAKFDAFLTYSLIAIGICMMVGLLTRLASAGAILFLISVIMAQPPWVDGANTQFLFYQIVEIFALLTLIATVAGRYAGLDFFIHKLCAGCCGSKETGDAS